MPFKLETFNPLQIQWLDLKRPLDYSKITEKGWKPKYTLDEGLKKTYEWFQEATNLQTK